MPVLEGVAKGCQFRDRAFWPQRLSHAVLPLPAEPIRTMESAEDEDETLGMLGMVDRYAANLE